MPLIGDQSERDDNREDHDSDAGHRILDGRRRDQPAHCLEHQQHGAADQKGRLPERRQRLSLPVTEAVFTVGRNRGVPDGNEIEQRGGEIDQRVDEARQQRDRAGADPHNELRGNQHRRDGQRGIGRTQPQPLCGGGLAQGKGGLLDHA